MAHSPAALQLVGGDQSPDINVGILASDRQDLAAALSGLVADAFTLYLKTHNFHWNVTGPMFHSLHKLFEEQYREQWEAIDELAERIRALGFKSPGSYAEFARISTIPEEPGMNLSCDWREMVEQLIEGNEAVCRTAKAVLEEADGASDDPTVDLMTRRLTVHEKNAWMLRAVLD